MNTSDRYLGLPKPIDMYRNSIFLGNNHVTENIPIYESGKFIYQLGWDSWGFFGFSQDGYDMDSTIHSPRGATQPISRYSNIIATRGVQTCTAVAVMRGKTAGLFHLDEGDLINEAKRKKDDKESIVNQSVEYLKKESGNIYIIASYVQSDTPLEETFVKNLAAAFQKLGEVNLVTFLRGSINDPPHLFGHVEFGLVLESGVPYVFGDVSSVGKRVEFEIPFNADQMEIDNIIAELWA